MTTSIHSFNYTIFQDLKLVKDSLRARKKQLDLLFDQHLQKQDTFQSYHVRLKSIDPILVGENRPHCSSVLSQVAMKISFFIKNVFYRVFGELSRMKTFYDAFNFQHEQLLATKEALDRDFDNYKRRYAQAVTSFNSFKKHDTRSTFWSFFSRTKNISDIESCPASVDPVQETFEPTLIDHFERILSDRDFASYFMTSFLPPVLSFESIEKPKLTSFKLTFERAYTKHAQLLNKPAQLDFQKTLEFHVQQESKTLVFAPGSITARAHLGTFNLEGLSVKSDSLSLKLKRDWIPTLTVPLSFSEFRSIFDASFFA